MNVCIHVRTQPSVLTCTPSAPRRGASVHGAGGTSQSIQLQQYKQRLQQMHQQLILGKQQLQEMQKHPNQQQKVCFVCLFVCLFCVVCVCVCVCLSVCLHVVVCMYTIVYNFCTWTLHCTLQAVQLQQQLQNGLVQYQRLQQVILQMQAAQVQVQPSQPPPQQQQQPQPPQQQQQEPAPAVS